MKFYLLIIYFLISISSNAQQRFIDEPFYSFMNKREEVLIKNFLKTVTPSILMSDYKFVKEIPFIWDSTTMEQYDTIYHSDFQFMPHSADSLNLIDLGFNFNYNKEKKQYQFLGSNKTQHNNLA